MSERRPFTVFYSWQSDLPTASNWSLVEGALERAAKTLRADDSLQVEPVMDRDTAGRSGAPDIAATIFEKIDAADAFVADVSFITPPTPEDPKRKRCPNPNVLLELGYALKRHGWARVLIVFNQHFGDERDLPFDLRGRRVILYRSDPDDSDRATPRRQLQDRIEAALRLILSELPTEPSLPARTATTLAIEAVNEERRNRSVAIRTALADITARIAGVAPDLAKENLDSQAFIRGLDAATPAIANYLEIASAAASMDDRATVVELVSALETVAVSYDLPPGQGGTVWLHQFDYWKQVGYELVLGLVALLLRDRHFGTLEELLKTRLHVPNASNTGDNQVLVDHLNPRTRLQQEAWGQWKLAGKNERYISPIGSLLKERYSSPPLSKILSWPELQAADLLLHMWSAGRVDKGSSFPWPWVAHAAVLMTQPPRFLTDSIRIGPARQLAQTLGLPSPDKLRELYVDRVRQDIRTPFRDALDVLPRIDFPGHSIASAS